MKIFLASDHAGFHHKEYLRNFLQSNYPEFEVQDFGAYEYDKDDDYPDYIALAAEAVNNSQDENSLAFVFGGSGQGEAIVANKFAEVRAAVIACENIDLVRLAKEHNNANILSFGARFVSTDFLERAIRVLLETDFNKDSRHARRIKKIKNICAKIKE